MRFHLLCSRASISCTALTVFASTPATPPSTLSPPEDPESTESNLWILSTSASTALEREGQRRGGGEGGGEGGVGWAEEGGEREGWDGQRSGRGM